MSKKVWMFVSIVLLGVLSLSFYNQHKKNIELDNYRYSFVSYLHGEINNCIFQLSRINSKNEKIQQGAFKSLINQLEVVDQLIRDAHHFMDRNILYEYPSVFYSISSIMDGGFTRNDQKICDGFLEDGKLSEKEIAFLVSLKKDLEKIQNRMYSDGSDRANYKLSVKEINDILSPFYNKYYTGELNLSN